MDSFPHFAPRPQARRSDDVSAYEPFDTSQEDHGLGKPMERQLCDVAEITALLACFGCSITALICSFHPATAAYLGQKYQLIIVGLMLSFMDLCTSKLITIVFLQLETRWASLLQNYDSIIKRSVLGSLLYKRRASQRWTLLLASSLAFPLLLSVSYKTFVGGKITTVLHTSGGDYGLTGPGGLANFSAGSSLMINATIPFMSTNATQIPLPPHPFGFNMLLLENNSVAMLDAPSSSYINAIRENLHSGQSYTVAAEVKALAWHLDPDADQHRNDESWWSQFYDKDRGSAKKLNHISLFKWHKWLSTLWKDDQISDFFVLLTPHEKDRKVKPTKERFQKEAIKFASRHLICDGKWKITRSTVDLIEGDCTRAFNTDLPSGCVALHLNDAVFLLGDFLGELETGKLDEKGKVRLTAVVSSLFWSRLAAYCGIDSPTNHLSPDDLAQFKYHRADQAWKTVVVLKRSPLLALVLLAHPIVALALLIVRIAFCSAPVSGGFGLISVLAGHRSNGEDILSGAVLSGDAKDPIELSFDTLGESCDDGGERLGFQLRKARNLRHRDQRRLVPKVKYY
ncbi:hypothetical protein NW752_010966 [Fusarium irregulare]|uniref:Uncharacterized protein n=1 Tax=Fusarium irregulare TaxID=2494466 RepID=A0A9W8PE79_9HYPO|nr:hypothetical protein NW766_011799 [Fusarium irregulare]KAJ4006317.1 hypothetical protein NW752_010966 [Fusarium irregulare]